MKKKLIVLVLLLPVILHLLAFNLIDLLPVRPPHISVLSISMNRTTLHFDRLNVTQQLLHEIHPANATNQMATWESLDPGIATVDNIGRVTAVSNGTTQVIATTVDGHLRAITNVTVHSLYLEVFDIWTEGDQDVMYPGDRLTVHARVETRDGLAGTVPAIETGDVNVMEVVQHWQRTSADTDSFYTFEAVVEAVNIGVTSIIMRGMQTADNIEHRSEIGIEVVQRPNEQLSLLFMGRSFNVDRPLVTLADTIPLLVNRDGEPTFNIINDIGSPIASIVGDDIVFTSAGMVTLEITLGGDVALVDVTSTMGALANVALPDTTLQIDGNPAVFTANATSMTMGLGTNSMVAFSTAGWPVDFASAYDVNWVSSAPAAVFINRLAQFNSVQISGHDTVSATITLTIAHREEPISHVFIINVTVVASGASSITLPISRTGHARGFENIYVTGAMNFQGEAYTHLMNPEVVLAPGASSAVLFESSNPLLAPVTETGVVTFNPAYFNDGRDYDGDYESHAVTITVRGAYQMPVITNPSEPYATASFTFNVVYGANVRTVSEFDVANMARRNIVLQNDMEFTSVQRIFRGIYGNDFRMDITRFDVALLETFFTFVQSDIINGWDPSGTSRPPTIPVVITNVRFLGHNSNDLNMLLNGGTLVELHSNTTLQYSRVEGASALIAVPFAYTEFTSWYRTDRYYATHDVHIRNSLLRNAGYGGIFLGEGDARDSHGTFGKDTQVRPETTQAQDVIVENLVFENTLMGIAFNLKEYHPGDPMRRPQNLTLTIRGFLKFYTWMEKSIADHYVFEIDDQTIGMGLFNFRGPSHEGVEFFKLPIALPSNVRITIPLSPAQHLTTLGAFDSETMDLLATDFSLVTNTGTLSPAGITLAVADFQRFMPNEGSIHFVSVEDQMRDMADSATAEATFARLLRRVA
ncbi:MAG: Ig-like domain-containing protein [Firmicutes bacterium]|nr:Ig-like domain-containing protein [Bacillota bacterium]